MANSHQPTFTLSCSRDNLADLRKILAQTGDDLYSHQHENDIQRAYVLLRDILRQIDLLQNHRFFSGVLDRSVPYSLHFAMRGDYFGPPNQLGVRTRLRNSTNHDFVRYPLEVEGAEILATPRVDFGADVALQPRW